MMENRQFPLIDANSEGLGCKGAQILDAAGFGPAILHQHRLAQISGSNGILVKGIAHS